MPKTKTAVSTSKPKKLNRAIREKIQWDILGEVHRLLCELADKHELGMLDVMAVVLEDLHGIDILDADPDMAELIQEQAELEGKTFNQMVLDYIVLGMKRNVPGFVEDRQLFGNGRFGQDLAPLLHSFIRTKLEAGTTAYDLMDGLRSIVSRCDDYRTERDEREEQEAARTEQPTTES